MTRSIYKSVRLIIVSFILLISGVIPINYHISAQKSSPTIIFVGGKELSTIYLAAFDPTTQTTRELFVPGSNTQKDLISLVPKVFSPDGSQFIVLEYRKRDGLLETAYCIHSQTGQRRYCIEKPLTRSADYADKFPITWSSDSKYIRYVADAGADSNMNLIVIEANAQDGKQIAILYEMPFDFYQTGGEIPLIAWAPDKPFLLLGANLYTPIRSATRPAVVDLQTTSKRSLSLIETSVKLQTACSLLSPRGNFIIVRNSEGDESKTRITAFLLLASATLSIFREVDLKSIEGTPICPVWNANEDAFYFYTVFTNGGLEHGSVIYKYLMSDQRLVELGRLDKYNIQGELAVSPDEKRIVFTVNIITNNRNIPRKLYMLDEQQHIQPIPLPYQWSSDPIWMP